MKRKASAVWTGNLKEGRGTMTAPSGAFTDVDYSFHSRFEEHDEPLTNPEELIAAAHAGCFSMAFSNELSKAGHTVERMETEAAVSLELRGGGFEIASVHLKTRGTVPGIEDEEFQRIAESAKKNCPVSKALRALDITLDAELA